MPNYSNGKIYKIVCNITGKIYIGSTVSTLSRRLSQHKSLYKRHLKGITRFTTSFDIIKEGDYKIVLIENVNCSNKEELSKRERYYIENLDCVNITIPLRTNKEYKEDKKEEIHQKNKIYYQKNIDKIHERNRIHHKNYYEKNIDKMRERALIYHHNNKDKKKEYYHQNKNKKRTVEYICDCGSKIQNQEKNRHFKSKKHIAYLESLNN